MDVIAALGRHDARHGFSVEAIADALAVIAVDEWSLIDACRAARDAWDLRLTCRAIATNVVDGTGRLGVIRPGAVAQEATFLLSPLEEAGTEASIAERWLQLERQFPRLGLFVDDRKLPGLADEFHIDRSMAIAAKLHVRHVLSLDNDGQAPFTGLSRRNARLRVLLAASVTSVAASTVAMDLEVFLSPFDVSLKVRDVPDETPPAWLAVALKIPSEVHVSVIAKIASENRLPVKEVGETVEHFLGHSWYKGAELVQRVPSQSEVDVLRRIRYSLTSPISILSVARVSVEMQRPLADVLEIVERYAPVIGRSDSAPREGSFVVSAAQLIALSRDLDGNDPIAHIDGLHLIRVAARLGISLAEARQELVPFESFGLYGGSRVSALAEWEPNWDELCILSDYLDERLLDPDVDLERAAKAIALNTGWSQRRVLGTLTMVEPLLGA